MEARRCLKSAETSLPFPRRRVPWAPFLIWAVTSPENTGPRSAFQRPSFQRRRVCLPSNRGRMRSFEACESNYRISAAAAMLLCYARDRRPNRLETSESTSLTRDFRCQDAGFYVAKRSIFSRQRLPMVFPRNSKLGNDGRKHATTSKEASNAVQPLSWVGS